MEAATSRRDRARVATTAEIVQTARRVLAADGVEAVALRAIARELGMTAPALYRYYPSRENLLNHVIADIYDELADHLRTTRDSVADPLVQLLEVARQFRRWALSHPKEFGLVFVTPIDVASMDTANDNPANAAGLRFAAVFAESLAALYEQAPFPVPADADIEPALRRQLQAWAKTFPIKLPIGALQIFLIGWIRIYGMVCMEVFGHLKFALSDGEPMFEHEIDSLANMLSTRRRERQTKRIKASPAAAKTKPATR